VGIGYRVVTPKVKKLRHYLRMLLSPPVDPVRPFTHSLDAPPCTLFCHYLSLSVIKMIAKVIKYIDLHLGLD